MYRTPPAEPTQSMVHRPGPRVVVYVAMVFLATIMVPGYIIEPARMLSGGGVVGLLAWLAFEVLLLSIARRSVILTVDARATRLTLRDVRWPFPGRVREVPVAEIRGVTRQKAPRGLSVRLALVLANGVEMPLTNSYFGGGGHMDRDAAALRKLCGLRE